MDWFTPLVGFLGVGIGLGYQEYRIRRERKDKYKDMVFEKRLDAHQGAYYWCMRLLEAGLPPNLMQDGGLTVLVDEINEAIEWLDKHALYLDEDSREKMDGLFRYLNKAGSRYIDKEGRKIINTEEERQMLVANLRVVLSSIKKGIGVKYLPEEKI